MRELSDALCAILKHNNYSVDAVYDGESATDYLETGIYDGVILDIMMPKRDGIEVLKLLRASGSKVLVLLLTAKSEVDDKVIGLDSGTDDYLTKPFAVKELLARLCAITRKSSDSSTNLLCFEDLCLDRSLYVLSCCDKSYELSNKEYQIAEMLMMNTNRIISAELMLEKIWGFDNEAELNVIWVYISNLRKKLSESGSRVKIRAVRNLGYIMEKKR